MVVKDFSVEFTVSVDIYRKSYVPIQDCIAHPQVWMGDLCVCQSHVLRRGRLVSPRREWSGAGLGWRTGD